MKSFKDLFTQVSFEIDDLQFLIDAHSEEHLQLEFKAAGTQENSDGKKHEIAKDATTMANAEGYILKRLKNWDIYAIFFNLKPT